MPPKCYVSYKSDDQCYRDEIDEMEIGAVENVYDNSADYDVDSIVLKLRRGALSDTTVTIHLIGTHNAESLGWEEQKYIKRELQASLLPSSDGMPNAIIGVVLPEAYGSVYTGGAVRINDVTAVCEFISANNDSPCCVLLRWDDFKVNPHEYIMEVYAARAAAAG